MQHWHYKSFAQLTADELYAILKLRQDVFVLEQQCLYPDIDNADQQARHLFCFDASNKDLLAYARLFAPGVVYPQAAIGRILTHHSVRGMGLGRELMHEAFRVLHAEHPASDIKISAQEHLQAFYQELGFVTTSAPYDEDGILHVDMVRAA